MKEHEKIIMLESGLKNFLIIAQFARGKLYLALAKKLQRSWAKFEKVNTVWFVTCFLHNCIAIHDTCNHNFNISTANCV